MRTTNQRRHAPGAGVRLLLLALLALVAAESRAAGDQPVLELSSEATRVGMEDTFTVTVALSGLTSDVGEPQLDLGAHFQVIGRSTGQSISFVNGRTSVESRYMFTIRPLREGIFDIGPARARWGSKEVTSGTTRVQVVAGSVVGSQQPSSPLDRWPDVFGERQRTRRAPTGKVQVVAAVDRREVFVGEPVTYTLRLLTQMNVRSVKPRSESQTTGLWVENLEVPNPPKAEQVNEGGEAWTSFLLRKQLLVPTNAGTVRLDPVAWDVAVLSTGFLFPQESEVTRTTEAIEIKVLPLPETGKPEGFSGAVGRFRIEAALSKSSVAVNDALSLKVTVRGTGNLRTAVPPALPPLGDFKSYGATEAAAGGKEGKLAGTRTWEYVLVPTAPGQHQIPPLQFSFFDPQARSYQTIETPPFAVEVSKPTGEAAQAPGVATGPAPAGARRAIQPVRHDVAYLKLVPDLKPDRRPLWWSPWVLGSLLLPVLLNLGGLAWLWSKNRDKGDLAGARRRGAWRTAAQRLEEADKLAQARKRDAFGEALAGALSGYVADRFGEPAAGLTRDRMTELLAGAGAGEEAGEIGRLLDRADYLRFTPSGGDPNEMRRLGREAATRLKALDRKLGRGARA